MMPLFSFPLLYHMTRLMRNICEQTAWNHSSAGTQTSRGQQADVPQVTEAPGCAIEVVTSLRLGLQLPASSLEFGKPLPCSEDFTFHSELCIVRTFF